MLLQLLFVLAAIIVGARLGGIFCLRTSAYCASH